MIRTPIARTGTLKPARARRCAVKGCGNRFAPRNMMHKVCGPACAEVHSAAERKRLDTKQARQERAQDRAKLDGMKTYPQLIADCQKAFNAVVRQRDMLAGHRCISSGRALDWNGNAVDAGHYRSTGSAPHLRFNFDNCHAQSKHDNQYKAGNAVDYRIGLIARIGLTRVEALEADNTPAKWTHDDLRRMTKEFRSQLKQLKEAS